MKKFVAPEKGPDVSRQRGGPGIGLPGGEEFSATGGQKFGGLGAFGSGWRTSDGETPGQFDSLRVVRSGGA